MKRLISSLALLSASAFAQPNYTVFGSGYALPAPLPAAPGQIVNLFVQGVGSKLTGRVAATTVPYPTVLAGISVTLHQQLEPQLLALPILAVRPVSTCVIASTQPPCGAYTVVTVQMPFELIAHIQVDPAATFLFSPPQLVVTENNVPGGVIDLIAGSDQVHILTTCDVNTSAGSGCFPAPMVTHADGKLVSAANPAENGEELVMYAFGLGATTPAVPNGQITSSPAPVTQENFMLNFDYRANAPASLPPPGPFALARIAQTVPLFTGLTPTLVGVYQINFKFPPPTPGMFGCGLFGISSNLTVTVAGSTSFDGAGICVDTGVVAVRN